MNETPPAKGAIGVLLLIVFFDMLAFGIIIPFTPFWAERYGASPFEVALLFSTYSAVAFISAFPWGVISDKWGRKPILCFSMLGTALSFAWVSQSDALWMLFAARALGGLMGGTIPVAQAYIADVTPRAERAGRMGMMGAAIGAGFVLGPGIGYLLSRAGTDESDFRMAFMIAAGVGLLGFLAALFFLREPKAMYASDEPQSIPAKLKSFGVAGAMPGLLYPLLILTMLAFCMAGLEATFPLWTERQLHWGAREVGIFFFYIGLIMVVVQGGMVRPLAKRYGEAKLMIAGALSMSLGFVSVLFVFAPPLAFAGGTLIAIGYGLANPTLSAMISKNAPDNIQGTAMGASQSTQALCRILGPLAFGAAFSGIGRDAPYVGAGIVMFIAFLIGFRALKYNRQTGQSD